MKKFFVSLFTIVLIQFSFGQIVTPVKWTWKAEPTGKGEYKLVFTAKIDDKWHTYTQTIVGDGPIPTSLTFDKTNKDVQLIGKPIESGAKVHSGHDPVFDIELKYFENNMVLEQKVKVLKDTKLKGTLEFMACDDKSCLPPDDKEFEFDLKLSADPQKKTDTSKIKSQGFNSSDQQKFDSVEIGRAHV